MRPFDYRLPESLEEAAALLSELGDDAKLIAGGTALVLLMKQDLVQPAYLVDLGRVPGLRGVRRTGGALAIGALTTHRELETSDEVRGACPVLAETLGKVATIRIRNMATIGGNLAHGDPNLDPPVTLLALDASVRLWSASGERDARLEDLFVDYYETAIQPTEILTDVLIPAMPPRSSGAFLKYTPRTEDDYGTVTVAVRLTADPSGERCQDVRIAIGCAGPTALRAREAEDELRGQVLGEGAFREVGALAYRAVDPISDVRGSAEYKQAMAAVFVRRALQEAHSRLLKLQ
ncbi:MAG: xanthine dehydrogenase family protein subunit M [Chloroflexi bacterium]|nr:xanthine dehydrogenase family protein subunit M [Chloroflexota bacterium]